MISNSDLSGGETVAVIALLTLGVWMAWPHLLDLPVLAAHANNIACKIAADLHG